MKKGRKSNNYISFKIIGDDAYYVTGTKEHLNIKEFELWKCVLNVDKQNKEIEVEEVEEMEKVEIEEIEKVENIEARKMNENERVSRFRVRTWDFRGSINPPCLNCQNRKVGCHSSCQLFKDYRNQLEEDKNKRKQEEFEYNAQFKYKEPKRQI